MIVLTESGGRLQEYAMVHALPKVYHTRYYSILGDGRDIESTAPKKDPPRLRLRPVRQWRPEADEKLGIALDLVAGGNTEATGPTGSLSALQGP